MAVFDRVFGGVRRDGHRPGNRQLLMRARALLASLALCTAVAASAQTDTTAGRSPLLDPQGYNTRQLPAVIPNNNIKNVSGQAFEKAMLRRGAGAALATAGAMWIGQEGLAGLSDYGWGNAASVVGNTAAGAGFGAVAGCVVVGAAAGVASFWAAGAGAVPGCVAGAAWGAQAGGFLGLSNGLANVTKDGTLRVDPNGNVKGTAVRPSATVPVAATNAQVVGASPYAGQATSNDALINSLLPQVGTLKTFPCRANTGSTTYMQCMMIPLTYVTYSYNPDTAKTAGPDGTVYTGVRSLYRLNPATTGLTFSSSPNGTIPDPPGGTCAAGSSTCWWGVAVKLSTSAPAAANVGQSTTALMQNPYITYSSAAAVPSVSYTVNMATPIFAAGFTNVLDPNVLGKRLDDAYVAAMINAMHAKGYGSAPVPYNAADPIVTPADVAAVADTGKFLTVGDLMAPVADLNAQGGTAANPLTNPVQTMPVGGVSPSTGTITGTTTNPTITKEKADTDLESQDFGALGNPVQPVIDFLAGPLAPFVNVTFDPPQTTQCIPFNADLRQSLGRLADNVPNLLTGQMGGPAPSAMVAAKDQLMQVDGQPVCDFFNEWYSTIVALNLMLIAVFVVYAFW